MKEEGCLLFYSGLSTQDWTGSSVRSNSSVSSLIRGPLTISGHEVYEFQSSLTSKVKSSRQTLPEILGHKHLSSVHSRPETQTSPTSSSKTRDEAPRLLHPSDLLRTRRSPYFYCPVTLPLSSEPLPLCVRGCRYAVRTHLTLNPFPVPIGLPILRNTTGSLSTVSIHY